ncbi:MAG: energy-coupling factor transporter transmembrane protein EcfT [Chloroflexota bacterium]|nr:energy-coupling factor transporter transmembrane protein EcfT [Chloroflexota bacterium]
MNNLNNAHTQKSDLACLLPPPGRRYVRSFLFSRRIDAPFARVHLLARILLVLCLSGALLRTINSSVPDPVGATLLSALAVSLFLLCGIATRMARFYMLLTLPALCALFLSWLLFNPVPGHHTFVHLPLYSGHLDIGLTVWQAIFLAIVLLYFLWTRKLFGGVIIALIVAFVLAHWVPLPEWEITQFSFFHPLTLLISDRSLETAVIKVIGYGGMMFGTIALVISARDVELIGALRQLHVPQPIIFFLGTVFRSLDLALADYQTIHQAQLARAIAARPRSFVRRLLDLASIAVPMVAIMIRRSSEIGDALQARGYTLSSSPVDFYETSPWRLIDWSVLVTSLGLLYLAIGPHVNMSGFVWI